MAAPAPASSPALPHTPLGALPDEVRDGAGHVGRAGALVRGTAR
ncbi:hypothetical protein ACFV7Q_00475 [Streptomyces sp. NPDC059851]